MDKTMAVIMSASVLMATAVIVLVVGSGSLGDFGNQAENVGQQGCNYQLQQLQDNPDYRDQVSPECRGENFQRVQQERSVVGGALDQLNN